MSAIAEYNGGADPARVWKERSFYWKRSPECDALRALVKSALVHPADYAWTLQGFGFLRTYLPFGPNPKRFRLNVWDANLAIPGVSTIHDHPWSFTSWIINGAFANVRFVEDHYSGEDYLWMRIKCGVTGGSLGTDAQPIRLREMPVEHYAAGDIYHQEAEEIHLSGFDNGTVTLNDRTGDTEMPRVFWPANSEWVDAKPREATGIEVLRTTALALERWKDEIPGI